MRLVVTAMKNEGPFILEWVAYHLSIGFDRFLTYTNDCEDGTDAIWDRLAALGHGAHERNDDIKPRGVQKTALMRADRHALAAEATWIACLDVDEFLNIRHGDGALDDLFAATPGADMILLCWRRFGSAGAPGFRDAPVIRQFTRAAPAICPYPFHNYGFKSLWRRDAAWARIGVHRPLDPDPARIGEATVVTADGAPAPAYRSRGLWLNPARAGYEGAQLNHYSLRSAESYLVKCDRGLPNSRLTDLDLGYWAERNFNQVKDETILRRAPQMEALLATLKSDPVLGPLHDEAVAWHQAKIRALLDEPGPLKLYLRALITQTGVATPEAARALNPLVARSWELDRAHRARKGGGRTGAPADGRIAGPDAAASADEAGDRKGRAP